MSDHRCKNCEHCKALGRTGANYASKKSRKLYYCTHPDADKLCTPSGKTIVPFIGYGDTTEESPLQHLEHCKLWCPLKGEYTVENRPESDYAAVGGGLCTVNHCYDEGGDVM